MEPEHLDVIVVGAGLSGVGAACHLAIRRPGSRVAVLEARGSLGGTWDLFRFPGVRSDSDMVTLGYVFRPWAQAKTIADGPSIRAYIEETAREYGVDRQVRFHHRVVAASFSSETARWTVEVERTDPGGEAEALALTCDFLYVCSGYYRYDEGYTPAFAGRERFAGRILHPQHWPEDLDHAGRRVVVIGSGATAVTLVPELARTAAQVTMLQRSPGYVVALPSEDALAELARRWLPRSVAVPLVRWRNVLLQLAGFQFSRRAPRLAKALLRKRVQAELPEGYDVDTHFAPRYEPWDQRLCLVPDGDLFASIRDGRASIVTDGVANFTETGVALTSGEHLDADIVVTATGLNLLAIGGMKLSVDGHEVDLASTVAYKGMMLSGVPNFALALGYSNASWTLKCDLVSQYVCRLLEYMERHDRQICVPLAPASPERRPLIDLTAGYVRRSEHLLPKQGPRAPWRLHQNYPRDLVLMRYRRLQDAGIRFGRARSAAGVTHPEVTRR
jgi:monooxygenase